MVNKKYLYFLFEKKRKNGSDFKTVFLEGVSIFNKSGFKGTTIK